MDYNSPSFVDRVVIVVLVGMIVLVLIGAWRIDEKRLAKRETRQVLCEAKGGTFAPDADLCFAPGVVINLK